jgi:hypothetical protein
MTPDKLEARRQWNREYMRRRRADPAYREQRRRRRADPVWRERQREYNRRRWADPAYREQQRERDRRRMADPAYREQRREYQRELQRRHQADPARRERRREHQRRYQASPAGRERRRENYRRYWADPAYRERAYERQSSSDAFALYQYEWRQRNRDYLRQQGRERRLKLKRIPNPRKGIKYTPAEDAVVMRDDLSITEMCYMLGRGYQSVAGRRARLRANR